MATYRTASMATSIPELVDCIELASPRHACTLKQADVQASEARKLAVEEVEKLLQQPEDLKRVDSLLKEYTQKHQARA